MPSLVVIGPQITEQQGGTQCAPQPICYMVPKDPSLNRVKGEMDRLTKKLSEIKSTKIKNLDQEPQQRKEVIDRNLDGNQDKSKQ